MTMSTLPPISPASSSTDLPLVRSSGTSVTCGSLLMSSKPGSFFHGSAWPTHTMSAPAFTIACTSAWPTAVLPSVTSTLRNFGSLVISLSILSSAMWSLSSLGNPISTACPARSRRAPTRTRCGALADLAVQVHDQRRPVVEVHEAEPPRQPLAEEQVVAVVQRRRAEQPACARLRGPAAAAATGSGGRPRAAGTAPRRSPGNLQLEAAFRRGRRHAERDAAARCPAAGSSAACARPGSCASGCHQRHRHRRLPITRFPGSRRRCTGSGRR